MPCSAALGGCFAPLPRPAAAMPACLLRGMGGLLAPRRMLWLLPFAALAPLVAAACSACCLPGGGSM
eukprot:2663131-Alexandrium_andersonii.AAC.1